MKRGYARVSTDGQELGRQIEALQRHGCDVIYTDVMSGTKKSRPELDKMLLEMQPGDTIVIQKLDRLGRSMINLLELMELFTKRGISFVSLSESFDTGTPAGKMMFTMLGAFAQFERDLISERTKSSLAFKKRNGVRLGAPPRISEATRKLILGEYLQGMEPVKAIAQKHKVSERTVFNIATNGK